jgi:3-oxoacyl-[acyl-carrier-protein] synthase III
MNNIKAVITGVGAFVPEYILTNEELSRWLIPPMSG